MKKLFVLAAAMAVSSAAYAGADFSIKPQGTKSQGNCVGVLSSVGTGNGGVVGGNGTQFGGQPVVDQTTTPGSRAALVHGAQQTDCSSLQQPN